MSYIYHLKSTATSKLKNAVFVCLIQRGGLICQLNLPLLTREGTPPEYRVDMTCPHISEVPKLTDDVDALDSGEHVTEFRVDEPARHLECGQALQRRDTPQACEEARDGLARCRWHGGSFALLATQAELERGSSALKRSTRSPSRTNMFSYST